MEMRNVSRTISAADEADRSRLRESTSFYFSVYRADVTVKSTSLPVDNGSD